VGVGELDAVAQHLLYQFLLRIEVVIEAAGLQIGVVGDIAEPGRA